MSIEISTSSPKFTLVVFCYRGEEELLPMTLSRAKAAIPGVSIHLFDDELDPLKAATVDTLIKLTGCTYERTTFDRKRNLNGKECVVGELHCMQKAMAQDDNTDGYVIKLDPDTVILRFNLVQDAIAKGAKWVSHSSTKGHFAGMFYAIHKSILDVVARNAEVMELPERCAEDETIGAMCYVAAAQGIYSWTDTDKAGNARKFAAFPCEKYNTSEYWGNVIYCAFAGHVITLGNTGLYGMTKSWQVINCRDLLWAFYNPAKAKLMVQNPEALTSLPEIELDVINIPANKARGISLESSNAILQGLVTSPLPEEVVPEEQSTQLEELKLV